MTVRHQTTRLFSTAKRVQDKCAAYYGEGLDDEARRSIVQDIWREVNFAVLHEKKRRRTARHKQAARSGRRSQPAGRPGGAAGLPGPA